jgi:hypothetical protein
MQSKGLIEIQRKLFDRLFELEVARTSGLQCSPLILSNAKNPRKILKKHPLQAKELERFERNLTGKEELKNWMTGSLTTLFIWSRLKNIVSSCTIRTTTPITPNLNILDRTELYTRNLQQIQNWPPSIMRRSPSSVLVHPEQQI